MAHTTLVALDSREGISISVVFTSTVLCLEAECLQLLKPPADLPFWLFLKLLNPFQSSFICPYTEWAPDSNSFKATQ